MKNLLFISDLHLEEQQPVITDLFLSCLKNEAMEADQLYILGDLFEVWVGDDDDSPYLQTIKQAIKAYVESGKQCFIMPGNRDFLLGKQFMRDTGANLLTDPTIIKRKNQTILLTHGDVLCTDDKRHQIYRNIIQHHLIQKFAKIVPIAWRKKIADKLRAESRKHFLRNNAKLRDVTESAVIEAFKKSKADIIIHGHTHIAGSHLHLDNKQRFVMGAWHKTGHAWLLNDTFEEIRISAKSHSKETV